MMWPNLVFPPINLWTTPRMNIDSPCISECYYDNRYGFCKSCGRTLPEISRWEKFNNNLKAMAVKNAKRRLELIKRDR